MAAERDDVPARRAMVTGEGLGVQLPLTAAPGVIGCPRASADTMRLTLLLENSARASPPLCRPRRLGGRVCRDSLARSLGDRVLREQSRGS